jgi:hypothetical protein
VLGIVIPCDGAWLAMIAPYDDWKTFWDRDEAEDWLEQELSR